MILKPILIIGATGKLMLRVFAALKAAGHDLHLCDDVIRAIGRQLRSVTKLNESAGSQAKAA